MPIVDRATRSPGILNMVYAAPGWGKTMLAAALAWYMYNTTGKKALYADWEDGESSIPGWVPLDLWVPALDKDPIDEAHELVIEAKKTRPPALIIDTVSSMGDRMLRSVCAKNLKGDDSKQTIRPKYTTAGGRELAGATMLDYGFAQVTFQNWAQGLSDVLRGGTHVLWCAHEKLCEIKDAGGASRDIVGGPDIIGSALTRSVPKVAQVMLRITSRMVDGRVTRVLQVENDGMYLAKDRYRALPSAGVRLGIDPNGLDKKPKSPDQFEQEIIEHGAKVWAAIFNRADKLRAVTKSSNQTQATPAQ